ncbi:MAG: ribonuclease P protein component [Lachnospiraceae bacterium]|nr:ribonuclease P protein component [Lachnospiraceae bacterium]
MWPFLLSQYLQGEDSLIETIKKTYEFDRVYKTGRSFANRYLVMYVYANDRKKSRLGVSVSKRVGNSVVRHRVSRLIKESFRLSFDMFNSGLDIVVIARKGTGNLKLEDVKGAFIHLLKLHGIYKERADG